MAAAVRNSRTSAPSRRWRPAPFRTGLTTGVPCWKETTVDPLLLCFSCRGCPLHRQRPCQRISNRVPIGSRLREMSVTLQLPWAGPPRCRTVAGLRRGSATTKADRCCLPPRCDVSVTTPSSTPDDIRPQRTMSTSDEVIPVVVSCGLLWLDVSRVGRTQNPPGATPCEFDSRLGHRYYRRHLLHTASRSTSPCHAGIVRVCP